MAQELEKMQTEWKRAYPTTSGHYAYRVNMSDPAEVVHVYLTGEHGGLRRYGWQDDGRMLAKRTHDPEAEPADAMAGFYLCEVGKMPATPVPISLEASECAPEKPVTKKKAVKKKTKKKSGNTSKQEDGSGTVDDDAPGVGA